MRMKDDEGELNPETIRIINERLKNVVEGKVMTTEELKERLYGHRYGASVQEVREWARNHTMTIVVQGGCVVDVKRVPEGWDYQIDDLDVKGR